MRKIRLKDSIYILENGEDIYSVIFTGTRRIKKFKVDGLVKEVIGNLSSPQEEKELYTKLGKYDEKEITSCINSLEKFGVLRKYSNSNISPRYSKQISFIDELTESWEETLNLHKRITSTNISVFGIGGIGTWIVNGLYQMGINEIKIADPDVVSESNLNRQLFFNSKDIGKYKVDVIKEKIPDAKIIPYKKKVSEDESLEEIIKDSNFLINCADSPSIAKTTEIIDSYARKENIPYCVAGGYNMHLGMVGPIIIPNKTKSFNDFLEFQKREDPLRGLKILKDIENPGNLGAVAGAVANMQLIEVFKHLIGKGNHNYDKFFEINFLDSSIDWREF